MKKLFVCCLAIFMLHFVFAQPETEVYLFDLTWNGDAYALSNPINISNNKGYDNQPSFLADGGSVLYARTVNGQTDVFQYIIGTKENKRLTNTEGSEYSPTPLPNGKAFSCILLEKDGTQLLWKYDMDGSNANVLIPEAVIGYHAWYTPRMTVSFVLGDPNTLQWHDVKNGSKAVIQMNVGRSIHKMPQSKSISYVDKSKKDSWVIRSWKKNSPLQTIATALPGSEDMAWTPEGNILMGRGDALYYLNPSGNITWKAIQSLENFGLSGISRLAVSPKGDKIAIVVNE